VAHVSLLRHGIHLRCEVYIPGKMCLLRFIAYNTHFLILLWVRVEHLASRLRGRMAVRISHDWQRILCHPSMCGGVGVF
jgi:hypothetical protein